MPANDDVELHTMVVCPGDDPAPMLLLRTPYGTGSHLSEAFGWARRGIGVALQDVRGRYASAGSFQPYRNEGDDGRATAEWLRRQDFCDGRLIGYGSSYAAHCATELAGRVPLDGLVLAVPALDAGASFRTDTGVPRLFARAGWWAEHGDSPVGRGPVLDRVLAADPTVLHTLPVTDLPDRIGLALPGFAADWRHTAPIDPAGDLVRRLAVGSIPAPPLLVLGGLHDSYRDHCVRLWRSWPDPSVRLLLGAWQHDLGLIDRQQHGDLTVADPHRLPIAGPIQRWITTVLADGAPPGRRVSCAIENPAAGRSWWRTDDPELPRRQIRLAPTTGGRFTVDPDDPHPGIFDTELVDDLAARTDVVTWQGPGLAADTELLGRVRVQAAGLAGDPPTGERDWALRLLARTAAGDLQLTGTLIRTAGDAVDVTLPYLAIRLAAGTRLALQISAHQFPLYPRDPLDGRDPLTATTLASGHRSVAGPITLTVPGGADPSDLADDPFDHRW